MDENTQKETSPQKPKQVPRVRVRPNKPAAEQNADKTTGNDGLKDFLSIIVPVYNEEESLVPLYGLIKKEMMELMGHRWEVIFVDDGSTDKSFEVIARLANSNKGKVKCIRFRKNFGKSAALSAGFKYARGSYVATMDSDLQDDPAEFKDMKLLIDKKGYDMVSGWKKVRHDPISKTVPSKFFNFVTSIASGIRLHDFNCGIKLYRREVVESLDVYGEMHRYLPALAHWNGFSVTEMPVQHHKRQYGVSKFGLSRFIRGFLDLLTVVFTTRFGRRPMHFFGVFGTIFMLVGFVIFAYLVIEWLAGMIYLSERPLSWFSLGLMVIGTQFFSVGLLGELLVKQNFKTSRQYIIRNKIL